MLLTNVQIVDVVRSVVLARHDVYIEKGLIKKISPNLSQDPTFLDGVREKPPVVVDLVGMFLSP